MNTHTMRLALFRAGTAMVTVGLLTTAQAQEAQQKTVVTELDEIAVTASKGEGAAIDELASVSVVGEETKEHTGANTVQNLLRNIPGLNALFATGETGAAVNIRGMEGYGRVAVTIDGARQNFQQSGHGLGTGSFTIEPEFLQDITVIRGPSANAYGSGAIGGVVDIRTKNPSDFLEAGETWASETMLRYNSNNGWATGETASARVNDAFAVLGSVVYRDNGVFEDGDGNEVSYSDNSVVRGMLKAEIDISDEQNLVLGYIRNSDNSNATSFETDTVSSNLTAQYSYTSFDNDLIDLRVNGYWTSTDVEQEYLSSGSSTYSAYYGMTRNVAIDTIGADVVNSSLFSTGALDHTLVYGLDGYVDEVTGDDPQYSGSAGATPAGTRYTYGTYIQDTIAYGEWLKVTGGIRYDAYEMDSDAVENSGSHLSPKITVGVSPFSGPALGGLEVYGSFAEAYRAPSLTETINQYTHSYGGYGSFNILPNPDLDPETSQNYEIGLNYKADGIFTESDGLRLKAALFQNNVEDYIELKTMGTNYQYQNLKEARIEGFEVEATYDAGLVYGGFSGTVQKGYNETDGGNIDSVPANKFVTSVGFRALDEKVNFGGQWEAFRAQDDTSAEDYDLLNVFASYEPRKGTTLSLNVDNLLDETYSPYGFSGNASGRAVMFTFKQRFGG